MCRVIVNNIHTVDSTVYWNNTIHQNIDYIDQVGSNTIIGYLSINMENPQREENRILL